MGKQEMGMDAGMQRKIGRRVMSLMRSRRMLMAVMMATAGALALSGCGFSRTNSRDYVQMGDVLLPGSTVAVLPFENLTNYPGAGQIATDLVSTELYSLNLYRVAETSRTRNQLTAAKVEADKLSDSTTAQAAGRTLGVDAVLVGSVSEYGYQHGLREEPVVGLTARLVRSADGAVLWASSQSEAGRGYFSRDSVNNVAQRVVTRMLKGLGGAAGTGIALPAVPLPPVDADTDPHTSVSP